MWRFLVGLAVAAVDDCTGWEPVRVSSVRLVREARLWSELKKKVIYSPPHVEGLVLGCIEADFASK